MSKGLRVWLLPAAQIAMTGVALACILAFAGGRQLLRSFVNVDWFWLSLGMACVALQAFWVARRWKIICDILSPKAPNIVTLFHQTGRSMIYSQLLPSSLAADAIRTAGTAKAMSVRDAFRAVVLDRLVGLVCLVAGCLMALSIVVWRFNVGVPLHVWQFMFTAIVCAAILAAVGTKLFHKLPLTGKIVVAAVDDVTLFWRHPAAARWAFALAFAAQIASVMSFAAFVKALSANASVWSSMLVLPFAQIVTILPVSVGGWGVREGAVAFAFTRLGADPVAGIAASVLFGLSGPVVGGLIELAHAASSIRSR